LAYDNKCNVAMVTAWFASPTRAGAGLTLAWMCNNEDMGPGREKRRRVGGCGLWRLLVWSVVVDVLPLPRHQEWKSSS